VLLFAAIGARIVPGHPMVLADHALADAVGANVAPAALRVFARLTHAGDPAVLTALGATVLAVLWWQRRRALAIAWVVALLGNALLNPALKRAFERARPPVEGMFASASGFSFPSGHSSGAIVAYGMLGYVALRTLPPRWQGAALVLLTAVIYTTAASRVMLQVHFASDVLAGLASGGTWLLTCIVITEAAAHWRSRRQDRKAHDRTA
jgi:undecaprenyl-diphosphatase